MLLPEGVLKPVLSQVGLVAEGEGECERFLFSLGAASRVWRVDRHGTHFFLNPAHYGFPLSREAETAEVTTE